MDYKIIANNPVMWLMCVPAVLVVAAQAWIFSKRAFKAAPSVNLTKKDCSLAFNVGAISAIGPSLAIFVVMIGMMTVIGAPVTWLRLSFIGAATTELTATTVGAKAMGVEMNTAEYGLIAFAASVWTMTLNGCGWLVFCGLFTNKMDKLMKRFTGGNIVVMSEICGAAVLGTASYLATDQGLRSRPHLFAVFTAALVMAFLNHFAPKWLREYNLGIAMIAGMTAAVVSLP